MNVFDRIERRWDLTLPDSYRILAENGLLDYENQNYLRLAEVEWFYPPHVDLH
ncbi:MAG TPA: hypothetical protein VFE47_32060 [Tepidisphaeraceae bacterium]|jgi:hypothetical protein|nr:hypothetical protein [Tepidisphaeraceae bacterium]